MPVVGNSSFYPSALLANGHLQTVWPSLFRKVPVHYQRERLITPDDDFLDLDWSRTGGRRVAVLSHGLEGNSHRAYMTGMVRALNAGGWDALAWNFRSCSGEINRQLRFYHSGSIDDLDLVVQHALNSESYDELALIGFSMGGNLSLLWLGKQGDNLDARIRGAALYSVPCALTDSADALAKPVNHIYMRRFLRMLEVKIRAKAELYPELISVEGFDRIRNFHDYDNRYTAPLHGFQNAEDYWSRCSSVSSIARVQVPTLLVNALDDPFLQGGCYPVDAAAASDQVYLEMPRHGGHNGFKSDWRSLQYWSETRALQFLEQIR